MTPLSVLCAPGSGVPAAAAAAAAGPAAASCPCRQGRPGPDQGFCCCLGHCCLWFCPSRCCCRHCCCWMGPLLPAVCCAASGRCLPRPRPRRRLLGATWHWAPVVGAAAHACVGGGGWVRGRCVWDARKQRSGRRGCLRRLMLSASRPVTHQSAAHLLMTATSSR